MVKMCDDEQIRTEMAGKARTMAAERFDCHIVRKALYDFYSSLEVK